MTEKDLPLAAFYGGWGDFEQGLVEVAASLNAEQLALPSSPHHWPVGMLLQHIVRNRVEWFQGWMGEGNPDLGVFMHWDPNENLPAHTSAELVAGLEATWQMIDDALARWTPADLGAVFSPPAFLEEAMRQFLGERTRQWIIWHTLEHEIYHGGELSLALGSYGLRPIYGGI